MKFSVIILFFYSFCILAFNRSDNSRLYDEVQIGKSAEFKSYTAVSSSVSLADNAQSTYSKPSFYNAQAIHTTREHGHQWIGDDESGYVQLDTEDGQSISFHPPDDAEVSSFDDVVMYTWEDTDGHNYEMMIEEFDSLAGLYDRTIDNWVFDIHTGDYTINDLPAAVQGYFANR